VTRNGKSEITESVSGGFVANPTGENGRGQAV
jgi:hypothetical protein